MIPFELVLVSDSFHLHVVYCNPLLIVGVLLMITVFKNETLMLCQHWLPPAAKWKTFLTVTFCALLPKTDEAHDKKATGEFD